VKPGDRILRLARRQIGRERGRERVVVRHQPQIDDLALR